MSGIDTGGDDAGLQRASRGLAFVAHSYVAHVSACPEKVWTALTAADATFLYGMTTHSTWTADAPLSVRRDACLVLSGRVLCVRRHERLSYALLSGPSDPPVYLTWSIRPMPSGCAIRLEIDEVDNTDSAEDAEDVWLPVLAGLQRSLDAD